MTPEEFAAAMRKLNEEQRGDPEVLHANADDLLCKLLRELGYGEGVEVFESLDVWYA